MSYFKYILVAVLGVMTVGCASTSEVKELRGEVAVIRTDLQDARFDAQEARRLAEEANARSRTTEEMLNRGFKRSMYK